MGCLQSAKKGMFESHSQKKNPKKFFVLQSSLEQREGEKKEIIYLMKIHKSCEGFALK